MRRTIDRHVLRRSFALCDISFPAHSFHRPFTQPERRSD